jgi:filamentous hemagglutinin family protein
MYTSSGILFTSSADVTSSGLGTVVNEAGGTYDITGGTRPDNGTNLFHSFGQFSVDTNQSAVFSNDSGLPTNYIISRVNGGSPSNILGTIDSTDFGSANMILMNPAGIMFGANATLNVGGSFHATTADYVRFGDDIFDADAVPQNGSSLFTAPPSAFGFLTSNPAPIDVQTGTFDFNTFQFTNVLQVPEGETMSFVGGSVNIGAPPGNPPAGFVLASLGRINLISVASEGEAMFDGTGFNVDNFTQLGDINVFGNSHVDASEIYIRGGQLTIDGGTLFPGVYAQAGYVNPATSSPNGGEVNIEVTGSVAITGREPNLSPAGIQTYSGASGGPAPGDVPDITIKAASLTMTDGAIIAAQRGDEGSAADITIEADTIEIRNGSAIINKNIYSGHGGSINITAPNIEIDSEGSSQFTGINAVSEFHPAYNGGLPLPIFQFADSAMITINADESLSIQGNAQINSDSFSFGNAGNITINAGDMMLVGEGTNTGLIGSQSGFAGDSGDISIHATGSINIENGFRISSNTFGSGDGGSTTVNANEGVNISGLRTQISSSTEKPQDTTVLDSFAQRLFNPDPNYTYSMLLSDLGIAPGPNDLMQVLEAANSFGFVAVTDFTPGDGGTVNVTTPKLTLSADARIETSTSWGIAISPTEIYGNAGNIIADVDTLLLESGASIRSNSGGLRLDGSIVAGEGNGGQINVSATDTIIITGSSPTTEEGSFVSTSTYGDGLGGDISLTAGNRVEISNGGVVNADSLAQVGSASGDAGNISVSSGNEIELNQGTISTRAVTADGGNISLNAPKMIYLVDSEITTSVESGLGGGGNIDIDPDFVILKSSSILANAFGGPGGNINIIAGNFIATPDSVVDASSALGIDGTVNISSPDEEVSEDLAVLPDNFLDVTSLISERCGTPSGGSSLVDAGPGGLTIDPDGYLPSYATATDLDYEEEKEGESNDVSSNHWWAPYSHESSLQIAQLTCSR